MLHGQRSCRGSCLVFPISPETRLFLKSCLWGCCPSLIPSHPLRPRSPAAVWFSAEAGACVATVGGGESVQVPEPTASSGAGLQPLGWRPNGEPAVPTAGGCPFLACPSFPQLLGHPWRLFQQPGSPQGLQVPTTPSASQCRFKGRSCLETGGNLWLRCDSGQTGGGDRGPPSRSVSRRSHGRSTPPKTPWGMQNGS